MKSKFYNYTLLNILIANAVMLGAAYLVMPERIVRGFDKLLGSLSNYDLDKALFYLGLLATCLGVEMVFLGWENCALRKLVKPSNSAKTDLIVGGLHFLGIGAVAGIFFTFGSAYVITQGVKSVLGFNLVHGVGNLLLQFLVWFVAFDFLVYWFHRLSHKLAFLWEAHKYHHSATEFTLLTGNRIHALEIGMRLIFTSIPLALLGTPIESFFAIICVRRTIDIFQHSMINWRYGWIGDWVVYSPIGHRLHHSALEVHRDKNFGDILPIWDRLFGTWYDGPVLNEEVDVTNNPYNKDTVLGDYLLSFRLFFKALLQSLRTGRWTISAKAKTPPLEQGAADHPT